VAFTDGGCTYGSGAPPATRSPRGGEGVAFSAADLIQECAGGFVGGRLRRRPGRPDSFDDGEADQGGRRADEVGSWLPRSSVGTSSVKLGPHSRAHEGDAPPNHTARSNATD
jgi:hypothetical protein